MGDEGLEQGLKNPEEMHKSDRRGTDSGTVPTQPHQAGASLDFLPF
jgi:hypothetical protein